MGTKILFFGGFGPMEETETAEQEEAEFKWFSDLFSFDTGMHHVVFGCSTFIRIPLTFKLPVVPKIKI